MTQQNSGTVRPAAVAPGPSAKDSRNLWILTGYAASFLALCGVFAYYFSAYLTH